MTFFWTSTPLSSYLQLTSLSHLSPLCPSIRTPTIMSSTMTMTKPSKANIGVYTNPAHDLWLAEASPSLEEVNAGKGLEPGEVTVAIKSTGICGYISLHRSFFPIFPNLSQSPPQHLLSKHTSLTLSFHHTAQTSTSGTPAASAPQWSSATTTSSGTNPPAS